MFYKIINKIKLHLKLKNSIFKTNLVKSDFEIIKIFIKLNIIKSVKLYKKNKFIITINNNSSFNNFLNLHKPGKPVKISLKNIIKINRKNHKLFIISTNKGLINNLEAEKYKLGGFIILNILQ